LPLTSFPAFQGSLLFRRSCFQILRFLPSWILWSNPKMTTEMMCSLRFSFWKYQIFADITWSVLTWFAFSILVVSFLSSGPVCP
jgi:hypothetical protein